MGEVRLSDCIEDALVSGQHDMFSEFLIHFKPWAEDNFLYLFKRTIQKNMKINGRECNSSVDMISYLAELHVVSPVYWNSYLHDMNSLDGRYQKQTIRKWVEGDILPERETIIQYCLWLSIPLNECNDMLRAAGHFALYYLNIYDITSIIYLKKNTDHIRLDMEEFKTIRNLHCEIAKLALSIPVYGKKTVSSKQTSINHDSENGYMEIKNGKLVYHPFKGMMSVYSQKVNDKVEETVKEFRGNQEVDSSGSQLYLTRYIEKKMISEDINIDELKTFIEKNIDLFGEIHFGIIQKIENYIDTSEYYFKNVYQYRGYFTERDNGHIMELPAHLEKRIVLLDSVEKQLQSNSRTNKYNIITSLLAADYESNMTDCYDVKRAGDFADINVILKGRKEKNRDKDIFYRYNHPSKTMLLRLLIVLGREDEIGSMMIRAGYWERDWIHEYNDDTENLLDITDYLIIYMIRFRDRLLETWASNQGKNPLTYLNQNRIRFPFHKMSLEIINKVETRLIKEYNVPDYKRKLRRYLLRHNPNKVREGEEI